MPNINSLKTNKTKHYYVFIGLLILAGVPLFFHQNLLFLSQYFQFYIIPLIWFIALFMSALIYAHKNKLNRLYLAFTLSISFIATAALIFIFYVFLNYSFVKDCDAGKVYFKYGIGGGYNYYLAKPDGVYFAAATFINQDTKEETLRRNVILETKGHNYYNDVNECLT